MVGAQTSIDFRAYATDYTVDGTLELGSERLSDHLEATTEIEIQAVTLRALDDGRIHRLSTATITVAELCLVVASGPRGRRDRRIRTRPQPLRAVASPYAVVGYFHAATTADPLVAANRRAIIALSPATVRYSMAGEAVEETHEGLLLVRSNVTQLAPATDDDVGLAKGLDGLARVDPQAKDMTGDVMVTRDDT